MRWSSRSASDDCQWMVADRPVLRGGAGADQAARQPLPRVFGPVERWLYRLCGVKADAEQTWPVYAFSLLAFSFFGVLVTYGIQRLQHLLPFNPQKLAAVEPALAFNTAASFTTNTN